MIIIHCLDNSWLDSDPFSKFKLIKEEVIPEYLTKEELQLISNKEIKIHRLKQVRDVFLFCCCTGLSYIDVKKLNSSEIGMGVDNDLWIFTRRGKTKVPSRVPLLELGKEILDRYKDDPDCRERIRSYPF